MAKTEAKSRPKWHTSRIVQRCCFCKGVIAPGHEFGDVELDRKGCRYCMEERKL